MSATEDQNYPSVVKKAWILYSVAAVTLATLLVLFVASDNEERMFFGIMPLAAAYVLRPTSKYMSKLIEKYTGIAPPPAPPAEEAAEDNKEA